LKYSSSVCIISQSAISSSLCISAQATTYFVCLIGNSPTIIFPSRSKEAAVPPYFA